MKKLIRSDLLRQRLCLIQNAETMGVVKACERAGKHRSYFYYWKSRFDRFGVDGLINQSSRPKFSPKRLSFDLEEHIKKLRLQTGYGKNRLHLILQDENKKVSLSTVGKVLDRQSLTVKRRKHSTQKKHTRRYELHYPGQRLQMDIKYVPSKLCPEGKKFYQYTIIDECTRMRYLGWRDSIWVKSVVDVLKEAQGYFGFKIDCVQTDNGIEFTYDHTAWVTAIYKEPKIHPLDKYCLSQNIRHKKIPPGAKELNGKVERSHRTDDEEFYNTIDEPFKNIEELQKQGQGWMLYYNNTRRHSSISNKTPNQFLKEKLKIYPQRVVTLPDR